MCLHSLTGHIAEYKCYLQGEHVTAFPQSPLTHVPGQLLWRYIPFVVTVAFMLSFGPFLSVAYEYWKYVDAQPGALPMKTAPIPASRLCSLGA